MSKANSPRMRTHNAIPLNDADNPTEGVSLEFKQTQRAPLIQP